MTEKKSVLVGYMRVSKADGSQATDLQRDALLAAGVDAGLLYEDMASGTKDNRLSVTGWDGPGRTAIFGPTL